MLGWVGCCCETEPDPCTDTFWDVQFKGCFSHDYIGGGTCELRRYSDDAVLATATIGPTGYASGTVTLSPAPTSGSGSYEVRLYVFPTEPSLRASSLPYNMVCGSAHGFAGEDGVALVATPDVTIPEATTGPGYTCCPTDDYRAIPKVVYLTDNAGTTTLNHLFGSVAYTGTATMVIPAGRQTSGGCATVVTDITIGITYTWACDSGALTRNVTSCSVFLNPAIASLRDIADVADISNVGNVDLTIQSPTSLSHFPVSATYAAFTERGASFGATSIVE